MIRACYEELESRRLLSFSPAVSYATGSDPQAVVTADFNNDGKLDLVTANAGENSVSVRLGNGAGGFGAANHFAAGANPRAVAAADFNNDGKLDLAAANPDGMSTLLGNGDGTFRTPFHTAFWWGALSLAAADFNADGNTDIAYASLDPTEYGLAFVQLLLGNGKGTFALGDFEWVDSYSPVALALADLNADGKDDAVTANEDTDTVSVLLGNGDGTLSYSWGPSDFATGPSPRAVAVGDFTGDGIPDLVTAGATVDVLPGNGDGTFRSPIRNSNTSGQMSVAAADFNSDGKLDIAAAILSGGVRVQLGNGNGTLGGFTDYASGGTSSRHVAVAHLNGDGRSDVAVANSNNSVGVLLNDGNWVTKTYVGPNSGGNWSTAANWSPSGVPTASDVVTISGKSVNLAASTTVGGLNLLGGATLTLGANGDRILRTSSLSISSNSKLNLNDNDLLIDYTGATPGATPYATIRGYVITGRNTGTGGIVTTNAGDTALAVADNALLGRTSWSGQPIDATTIIGKYTFLGDANLDGQVTTDDYVAVDLGLGRTNAQWIQGDMDFTGSVTTDDYVVIDLNLGKGTSDPLAWADDQEAMIALHAEQFGESYVEAVEQATKGNYKSTGTKKSVAKKR